MAKLRKKCNDASNVSAVTAESRIEETTDDHLNISGVTALQKPNKRVSDLIEDSSSTDSGNTMLDKEQENIPPKIRKIESSMPKENGQL